MKPALTQQDFEQPHSWQSLKNGQWVMDSIQARLDEWSPKLFGYHMLKLGGLSCELMTKNCNIKHQINIDTINPLHNVIADAYHLPLIEKSIDAAIVCHQLDYCSDPHQLLREIDRTIIEDGHIIITGFNPISINGLKRFMPWMKRKLPWNGRMFTPYRVKDWLGLLNYEILYCECYGGRSRKKNRIAADLVVSDCSGRASMFGSAYFIVAKKRTYPLIPTKPHWKLNQRLVTANVGYNKVGQQQRSTRNER